MKVKIANAKDFYSGAENLIDLDRALIKIVRLLHEKNYKTVASCAGHFGGKRTTNGTNFYDYNNQGYIWINSLIRQKLPKRFKWGLDNCIRWQFETGKQRDKYLKILYKYIEKWPSI